MKSAAANDWIAWFGRNPVAANLLMVMIIAAGTVSVSTIRVEGFPAIPPKFISIVFPYEASTAQDADEALAGKIADALKGIQGIKRFTTRSTTGQVEITIEKTDSYRMDILLRDIKTRIDAVGNLPAAVEKPIVKRHDLLEYVSSVQVTGSVSLDVLLSTTKRLHQRLLDNPNIDHVTTAGARTPEVAIEVARAQLQSMKLTLADVAERVNAFSGLSGRSELHTKDGSFAVKAHRQGRYPSDFSKIPLLAQGDGPRVQLGDLARITDDYHGDRVLSRFNGQQSFGLQVDGGREADILSVAKSVSDVVDRFRATELPAGVSVTTWYDTSGYIRDRLALMAKNSLTGMVLVFILLAVFLNLRVALWVAVGLPVAVLGAMLLLGKNAFDMTLNELTTFGFLIAFGVIVDDAVIVGESIYSNQNGSTAARADSIRGAQQVATPIIFGVLTTVVAFLALTMVQGTMGKLFSQFALVVCFCLAFSLIESLLILPAHLARSPSLEHSSKWWIAAAWARFQGAAARLLESFIFNIYAPALMHFVWGRYAVLAVAVGACIVVGGMLVTGQVRTVFFPDIPGDVVSVEVSTHDNAGYGLAHRAALDVERAAHELDRALMAEYGLSAPLIRNLQVTSETAAGASVVAELVPRDERPISGDEFASRWRESTPTMEGVRGLEFTASWGRVPDISIELQVNDQTMLRRVNADVLSTLEGTKNVTDVKSSLRPSQPQLELALRPLGSALGLTRANLADQIQYLTEGYEVQRLQRENQEVKVTVRYPSDERFHVAAIAGSSVQTPGGVSVPLDLVADLQMTYVANEVMRVGTIPTALVTADVDKHVTSPAEVRQMLKTSVFSQLEEQNPDLRIKFGGEASEEERTTRSFVWIAALALITIYALLAVPLRSYLQPLVIMSVIPFGIVGAVLGHWITGLPVSLLSVFGILALCGIVVNDSLLLVARFNQLTAQGTPLYDAVRNAACHRMRAIVLTSATTFAGLAPLMAERAEQAQVLIPAAVSIGYGILFATAITLILLPSLILILNDLSQLASTRGRHSVHSRSVLRLGMSRRRLSPRTRHDR